jgi:hypothetical protein
LLVGLESVTPFSVCCHPVSIRPSPLLTG